MKKIIPIFFISFILGQAMIDNDPIFIPGEEYKYDLFIDFIQVGPDLIKLGSASFHTKEIEKINGQDAYHFSFVLKTSKVGDIVYKIRDKIDVWVDVETLTVVKQVKKLREGNRRSESITIVKGNTAKTDDKEYQVPNNVLDPYSLIMVLKDANIGEKESKIFTILDGKKIRKIEIQNIGIKTVRTPAGKFDAYTYKPLHNGKSALKNKGDIQVSYGVVNNRTIPVKISLKLNNGIIVLKLKKSSNIIN